MSNLIYAGSLLILIFLITILSSIMQRDNRPKPALKPVRVEDDPLIRRRRRNMR
jgi:hypothetical protein